MEGKRLIEKIRLRNILSFGDKGEEIELQPLNIIIGQNASGKSNLVDVLKLLRSLPQDKGLATFISKNGGVNEWFWKGRHTDNYAEIKIYYKGKPLQISYKIQITEDPFDSRVSIFNETVISEKTGKILIERDTLNEESFLGFSYRQQKDELVFPRFELRHFFNALVTYTDLQTNRASEIRRPQIPDAPNDFLEESGSNLALVLNDLEHRGNEKDKIVENLKKFNPQIKDYSVRILGGTVQLFIREEGLEKPISAMRLSDGTLRYLCLLAILCHPEPPPLICIEEPETGLHPDILPTIAELMKEASQRTQLIVTTHSDILVSAFSDMPEAVLVCEKDEDGTHFERLEAERLKVWLEEYTLGEAWLRGAIGGTRW